MLNFTLDLCHSQSNASLYIIYEMALIAEVCYIVEVAKQWDS